MSDDLYTLVGHRRLDFMNPMSERTVRSLLDLLDLPRGGNIADFGAGTCELPIRLAGRYGVHADCVELSPRIAAEARRRGAERAGDLVTVHEGDAGAFKTNIPAGTFDCTICIGSTHALGGYEHAVRTLARLTRPGGLVVVGEGFWERVPDPAYLKATGLGADEFTTHAENVERARALGLVPMWCTSASVQDWDDYEWAHARGIEEYAGAHAEDAHAAAMLARSRAWREQYVRHGRGTLGFGVYVFRVPRTSAMNG